MREDAVHEGDLYVGTCEVGNEPTGKVYRYAVGPVESLGSPDGSNTVSAWPPKPSWQQHLIGLTAAIGLHAAMMISVAWRLSRRPKNIGLDTTDDSVG